MKLAIPSPLAGWHDITRRSSAVVVGVPFAVAFNWRQEFVCIPRPPFSAARFVEKEQKRFEPETVQRVPVLT